MITFCQSTPKELTPLVSERVLEAMMGETRIVMRDSYLRSADDGVTRVAAAYSTDGSYLGIVTSLISGGVLAVRQLADIDFSPSECHLVVPSLPEGRSYPEGTMVLRDATTGFAHLTDVHDVSPSSEGNAYQTLLNTIRVLGVDHFYDEQEAFLTFVDEAEAMEIYMDVVTRQDLRRALTELGWTHSVSGCWINPALSDDGHRAVLAELYGDEPERILDVRDCLAA